MMGGSRTNITLSPLLYEQVDVQISGQGGDSTTIGVTSNAIPRSGGNRFAGSFLTNGANSDMQSDNLTQRLKDLGLAATSSLKSVFDVNGAVGGPIAKRPAVVLRHGPLPDQHQLHRRSVLSRPIRRRSSEPRIERNQAYDDQFVWDTTRPIHRVAQPEAPGQWLLRHPAQVVAALDDLGGLLARSGRHGRLAAAPLSGHAHLHRDEPDADRGGLQLRRQPRHDLPARG